MDANLAIAIAGIGGTLAGTIISSVSTYLIESRISEKARNWEMQMEDKRKEHEIDAEKRTIRRDLLSKRLAVIEENANIMYFLAALYIREEVGIPIYSDANMIQEKRKRMDEISNQAWTAISAIGHAEMKKNYTAISAAFYEGEESGSISGEKWKKAQSGLTNLIQNIDELKISGSIELESMALR